MDKELNLRIKFSKKLSEEEQTKLWDLLVEEIEKLHLRAGGNNDRSKLDWVINYSDSSLSKGEIIDKLSDFILNNDKLISNFEIK